MTAVPTGFTLTPTNAVLNATTITNGLLLTGAVTGVEAGQFVDLFNSQNVKIGSAPVDATGAFALSVSRQVLSTVLNGDGTYQLTAKVQDAAGNTPTNAPLAVSLLIDTAVPTKPTNFMLTAMAQRGSGAIVNIASVVAVAGQPGYLHYVASKGAVLAMTKGLAKECGASNVRVNVIAPGFVITDATKNRPVEWQQSFLKARAISREQRPDDLVGTAMYLMSDLSAFVSGQTIVVDGGHIMY